MSLRIEPRRGISWQMLYLTPPLAVLLTVLTGFALFVLMGYDPFRALYAFFVSPLTTGYGLAELGVKAAPLITIAVGLAIGFRANVWNIGAEGQLTMGAIAGGGVGLLFWGQEGGWILPLMMLAGVAGGMAWAAIPAFLKARLEVSEILTSLMLTYVAALFLSVLVYGPFKDPEGYGFPQSRMFTDAAIVPVILEGTRLHVGAIIALAVAVGAWVLMARSIIGFEVKVVGQAPAAARFAGFARGRIIWFCLLLSGGLAGLAGTIEVSGPIGQLIPTLTPGYGFTAIIVAFLGRLHPLGIIPAGLLVALSYIGGENAQVEVGVPPGATGLFQGLLLFFLLASDFLVRYRIAFVPSSPRREVARMSLDIAIPVLLTIISAATPLLLAGIGELVVERSGVLNLGVEGMMLAGAVTAFAVAFATGSYTLAILAAVLAGMAMAFVFGVLTLTLVSNQVATGLALTLFGLGLSALVGAGFVGSPIAPLPKLALPGLSGLPVIGPVLFGQDVLVYLSVALTLGVAWFLKSTRGGMVLRACGDSDLSAHAIGYDVIRLRYLAVLFGGLCAGLAGAFLSLSYTPMWVEQMTAGRGWIALALVVFASWRPLRLLAGAYLFGGVSVLQLYVQGMGGIGVPSQVMSMLPYLATILVLTLISARSLRGRLDAPACLGKPFRPAT